VETTIVVCVVLLTAQQSIRFFFWADDRLRMWSGRGFFGHYRLFAERRRLGRQKGAHA
jgi:hypothetical protein